MTYTQPLNTVEVVHSETCYTVMYRGGLATAKTAEHISEEVTSYLAKQEPRQAVRIVIHAGAREKLGQRTAHFLESIVSNHNRSAAEISRLSQRVTEQERALAQAKMDMRFVGRFNAEFGSENDSR